MDIILQYPIYMVPVHMQFQISASKLWKNITERKENKRIIYRFQNEILLNSKNCSLVPIVTKNNHDKTS